MKPTLRGYDPSFLDALTGRFRVFPGSPAVTTRSDVIYMPQFSCLYSSDGRRLDASCSHKGPEGRLDTVATRIVSPPGTHGPPAAPPDEIGPPEGLRTMRDRCIYAGYFEDHYGRFLTQAIARLWYALEDREAPLLWHGLERGAGPVQAFVETFFGAGVVDRSRFVSFREPVRLREVVIPQPSFSLNREGFAAHRLLPEGVARHWLRSALETTGQPLYLSRRHVEQRRIIGEAALEEKLQESGFAIVCPERLDLARQIQLMNRHEVIVGVEGSALHGVLFDVSARRNMVCLASRESGFRTTFPIVDAIKQVCSTYVSALRKEARPKKDGRFWRKEGAPAKRDRILDVDAALDGLRGIGLI